MESNGGGVVTAAATTIAPRRLQHSTLRETFLAADLAESNAVLNTNCSYYYNNNYTTTPNNNNDNNNNFGVNRRPVSSVTLGAVLNSDKKSPPPNNVVVRTLLEIIRSDENLYNVASPKSRNRKSWKIFKERLKLKKPPIPSSRHNRNQNQNQNRNQDQNHNQNQNLNPNPQRREPISPAPQSQVARSSRPVPMNADRNSLRNSLRNNSLRRLDGAPADELALREVDTGGSPRSGGSFRLSAALQAEREETRRRLSKELVEGNNNNNNNNGNDNNEADASRANGNSDEDEEDDEEGSGIPGLGSSENQPVRMSLMDLLEETDRQAGISGSTYRLDEEEEYEEDYDEEEEEEKEEEEEGSCSKGDHSCCVCMVRHKGSAFIPCGHTFCRLCSRELLVQRGNCPLCNNFILEILDIF